MHIRFLPSIPVVSPIDSIPRSAKVAFINGDCRLTHERLALAVDRLAAGMIDFGVQPGDRVCLHLRNGAEIAIPYYACFRLGAIAMPTNLRFTPVELESLLRRVRPALYLGHAEFYGGIAGVDPSVLAGNARFVVGNTDDIRARSWTDLLGDPAHAPSAGCVDLHAPAVLLTTSGTTGQPKIVAHSLDTLTHITARFAHLGFASGRVLAFIMPMTHVSGLSMFFAAMRLGVTVVFVDGASPDALLETIEGHRCAIFGGAATTIAQVIDSQRRQPRDVASPWMCLTSTDVCPPGQQEAFRPVFGLPLRSFWASTEAVAPLTYGLQTGVVSRLMPDIEMRLVGTDGMPAPTGQTGEMLLRGPNVMLGY